jgi:shikimate kinase
MRSSPNDPVYRIHIIGGPGSGKTTLARRISSAQSIPAFDLDTIGYENGAGAKRPLADRLADTAAVARQDAWITEGIFLWWIDELLRRADVIIWLDVPWRVAAWRIARRHMTASLSGTNRHRGLRRLWRFLLAARRYYLEPAVRLHAPDDDAAMTRAATAEALPPHASRIVHCRTSEDVARFSMSATSAAS